MNNIISKSLENIGLSKEQIVIYLYLLQNGDSPVKTISVKTGVGRAFTYKILEQLISLGLVEKREEAGKVTRFFPRHPERLKELVGSKEAQIMEAKKLFAENYGELASFYNMLAGKPNLQFLEGIEGLQKVYEDILSLNQDICVISSPINEKKTEVLHLIREQIQKQVACNIKTKAITPLGTGHELATPVSDDEKYLITRKAVPADKLNIPAQIIIYGDKVAITNFRESIITVLIDSKYIAETFREMFDYIWERS